MNFGSRDIGLTNLVLKSTGISLGGETSGDTGWKWVFAGVYMRSTWKAGLSADNFDGNVGNASLDHDLYLWDENKPFQGSKPTGGDWKDKIPGYWHLGLSGSVSSSGDIKVSVKTGGIEFSNETLSLW